MGCLTCCASSHIEANRAEGGGLLDAISYAQSECSMGGLSKFACNWAPMCFFGGIAAKQTRCNICPTLYS